VPSRKGFFSCTATRPSSVMLTCSWAMGGRSTYLNRFCLPTSSSAPARVAGGYADATRKLPNVLSRSWPVAHASGAS
jgi:hypothetical protein